MGPYKPGGIQIGFWSAGELKTSVRPLDYKKNENQRRTDKRKDEREEDEEKSEKKKTKKIEDNENQKKAKQRRRRKPRKRRRKGPGWSILKSRRMGKARKGTARNGKAVAPRLGVRRNHQQKPKEKNIWRCTMSISHGAATAWEDGAGTRNIHESKEAKKKTEKPQG